MQSAVTVRLCEVMLGLGSERERRDLADEVFLSAGRSGTGGRGLAT